MSTTTSSSSLNPITVTVRVATPADYDAVAALVRSSFAAGPYGHLHASPERVALESDSAGRAAAGSLLVAETVDHRIVGTASLLRSDAAQARVALEGEVELRLVGVDPMIQGSGIGDALVAASIVEARGMGARALVLDTGSLNLRAQRLYLRHGFERVTERETLTEDDVVSLVYSFDLEQAEGIRVRLVRSDEISLVADLTENAYVSDYPDLPAGYRASLRDVATRAREHEIWIAEDVSTGAILGTVATPREGSWISELGRDGELDFRLLAVDPAARGRGIGELLTRHVIALARSRGLSRVVMNSGPEMLGAHRLYDRLGFDRLPDRSVTFTDSGQTITLLTFGFDVAP